MRAIEPWHPPWEYQALNTSDPAWLAQLQELGQQGWEATCEIHTSDRSDHWILLKRHLI